MDQQRHSNYCFFQLNVLQEAHEREITTYMSNIAPMREQLDVQQVSIGTLQGQLASAKEELAIISVERDHLEDKLKGLERFQAECPNGETDYQASLEKKVCLLFCRWYYYFFFVNCFFRHNVIGQ